MEENEEQEFISNLTQLQKRIKLHLAQLAVKKRRTTYSELCAQLSLPYSMDNPYHSNLISEDLGAISREEVNEYEWPMLSSVVVKKSAGREMPGKGFFTLAEELYAVRLRTDERIYFWAEELKKTFEAWAAPEGREEIIRLEKELSH